MKRFSIIFFIIMAVSTGCLNKKIPPKAAPLITPTQGTTIPLDKQEAFAVTETAKILVLAGENDIRFIQQTSDNGYIIAGNTAFFGSPDSDMLLIRTDSSGKVLWIKKPGKGFMLCVRQTADNGFVASGMMRVAELDSDAFFTGIDRSGKTLWSKTYDDNKKIGKAIFIEPPPASGYSLTVLEYKNGVYKYFRMSTDPAGNMLSKTPMPDGMDYEDSPVPLSGGGFIAASQENETVKIPSDEGYFDEKPVGRATLALKDSAGNELWKKKFVAGTFNVFGRAAARTSDGGFIFAGLVEYNKKGETHLFLVRTDKDGNPSGWPH